MGDTVPVIDVMDKKPLLRGFVKCDRIRRPERLIAGLLALGYTIEETAKTAGVPEARVRVLLKQPIFQAEIERNHKRYMEANAEDIRKRIHSHAPRAVETVAEVMEDENQPGNARILAAKVFIDRVAPIEGQKSGPQVVINITQQEANDLKSVIAEYSKLDSSVVEDAGSDDS